MTLTVSLHHVETAASSSQLSDHRLALTLYSLKGTAAWNSSSLLVCEPSSLCLD